MLNSLYIENIAVIEKTNIDFTGGFNVLTGETGAGKSIVIDSINALLGHRMSKDIIRTGETKAFVSGTFTDVTASVIDKLSELGYDLDDDELILQRQLNINGKNNCRINGRPVTLSVLKEIASELINIHGQHESYQLMSPEKHITYIDSLGQLKNGLDEYKDTFNSLKECRHKLDNAVSNDSDRERKIDLLKYQIDELEEADLKAGEYEQLTEEKNVYVNKEKISNALELAHSSLNGDEDTSGVISMLEDTVDSLSEISDYISEVNNINERINNVFYELQDCSQEIASLIDDSPMDSFGIDEIEQRLDTIYRLSRKYGSTAEEMLDYLAKCQDELEALEQYEANLDRLNAEYAKIVESAKAQAKALSRKRQAICQQFTEKVKKEMVYLDMPNVNLQVLQERCPLNGVGCDKIEFLISTNPGEPPKPVSKIASGGELSRMMLAIKNVLSNNDIIDTLIFDEVDTGISGSATEKVGLKLKSLSKSKQVICVTHQAQIAALADSHYFIKKNVADGRTYTQVQFLNHGQRVKELARIIGGVSITELTMKHAEEMLLSADK
ncbi:MAG TPA: DNA repair protein RecN [Clostridiales bacterium]|nr:DNA repair protein RecN [Clostridiales bacterium]